LYKPLITAFLFDLQKLLKYTQIMKIVEQRAYAKVNFGLKVLPPRGDGFHNLESIFQTVNLFDTVKVRVTNDGGLSVKCSQMELPEENTITKTCRAFESVTGQKLPSMEVVLEKGIPSGGGLGGGSSDAAALVRILEEITDTVLTDKQIWEIAGMVGSDVFFFSAFKDGQGCAVVTGRGEFVRPIKGRSDLYLVLVFPPKASSTPRAYALVDQLLSKGQDLSYPPLEKLEDIYNGSVTNWTFENTFTPAISGEIPEITQAIKQVIKTGAQFTSLSGSGSTVFGIYSTATQAQKACEILHEKWNCTVAKTTTELTGGLYADQRTQNQKS